MLTRFKLVEKALTYPLRFITMNRKPGCSPARARKAPDDVKRMVYAVRSSLFKECSPRLNIVSKHKILFVFCYSPTCGRDPRVHRCLRLNHGFSGGHPGRRCRAVEGSFR